MAGSAGTAVLSYAIRARATARCAGWRRRSGAIGMAGPIMTSDGTEGTEGRMDIGGQAGVLGTGTLFHVGHAVEDLEATARWLTQCFGIRWAPTRTRRLKVVVDGEPRDAHLAITYSVDPPYIELVQDLPGSNMGVWDLRLDHAGIYVDDVAASARLLRERGIPDRVRVLADDGLTRISLHESAGGLWFELVPRSFQAELDQWFAECEPTETSSPADSTLAAGTSSAPAEVDQTPNCAGIIG
jgi:hypothetical protein